MLRPGLSFKQNPPKTPEPRVKPTRRAKIYGVCDWCKAKGTDLIKNKYGTFHTDGKRKCFRQFFFGKIKDSPSTPPNVAHSSPGLQEPK